MKNVRRYVHCICDVAWSSFVKNQKQQQNRGQKGKQISPHERGAVEAYGSCTATSRRRKGKGEGSAIAGWNQSFRFVFFFFFFFFFCIFLAFCCFLGVFLSFFGDFIVTVYILSLRIHLCDTRTLLSVLMHHPASLSLSLHVPWIRYRRSKREEKLKRREKSKGRSETKNSGREHLIENENPRRTRGNFRLSVRTPLFCACCVVMYVVCALVISWRR